VRVLGGGSLRHRLCPHPLVGTSVAGTLQARIASLVEAIETDAARERQRTGGGGGGISEEAAEEEEEGISSWWNRPIG
jgi:hypothetical protein